MARDWPFFGTLVDDVEMVLAKSDLGHLRALFAPGRRRCTPAYYPSIRAEFERTRDAVLAIKGETSCWRDDPRLRLSIRLRNPYVDPISLLQVDLLARWRAHGRRGRGAVPGAGGHRQRHRGRHAEHRLRLRAASVGVKIQPPTTGRTSMNIKPFVVAACLVAASLAQAQTLQTIKIRAPGAAAGAGRANRPGRVGSPEAGGREQEAARGERRAASSAWRTSATSVAAKSAPYCPTPAQTISRNTAGAETNCADAGGYMCEPVSGLCRTQLPDLYGYVRRRLDLRRQPGVSTAVIEPPRADTESRVRPPSRRSRRAIPSRCLRAVAGGA